MIINSPTVGTVTTNAPSERMAVTIKTSGKAFRAILDGIYKDKPSSIVRELSANALDAHRMVGKADRPFEIHAPTMYEPFFSIRDYGCSMSPEAIAKVYGVLFESTKDTSNDQIGGFGLGGKNFLAYQDSGTIITYLDGIKRNYVMMYNEVGEPDIFPMGEEPTEEENGVYVEVAVKDGDHHLFTYAIQNQLRWLKVKPSISNAPTLKITTPVLGKAYGKFYELSDNSFWIVQGEIGYKIDMKELKLNIKNQQALRFFEAFSGGAMFFDIGDIQVTLGREDIQYSKHTIESIERFIAETAPLIVGDLKEKLSALPNDWERIVFLNSSPSNRRIVNMLDYKFKLDYLQGGGFSEYQLMLKKFIHHGNGKFSLTHFLNNKRIKFTKNRTNLIPKPNMKIVVRDIDRNAFSYVEHAARAMDNSYVLVQHILGPSNMTDDVIDEVRAAFGNAEIIRASELKPLPNETSKSNFRYVKAIAYEYHSTDILMNSLNGWDKVYAEDDIAEKGYYVEVDGYPYTGLTDKDMTLLRVMINSKAIGNGESFRLYAANKKNINRFKNNKNFIDIKTVINSTVEALKEKLHNGVVASYHKAKTLNDMVGVTVRHTGLNNLTVSDMSKVAASSNRIGKLISTYRSSTETMVDFTKNILPSMSALDRMVFNDLVNSYDHKYNFNFPTVDEIKAIYPMLGYVDDYTDGNDRYGKDKEVSNNLVDYITVVDLTKDTKKK